MRTRLMISGVLLCIQPLTTQATSLQSVLEAVASTHPELQMADQQVRSASGNRDEQTAYAYNPELSLEPQRRRLNGGGKTNDYYITLSQGIEIGGKRGYRAQSAEAALNAARQRRELVHQQLISKAAKAYVQLYFANQAYTLRRQQSDMLARVNHAVSQKLALGEASRLDTNLASSAYASALNATVVASQQLMQAKQQYLLALGQSQGVVQLSELVMPQLDTGWQPPEDAYHIALESRPDLAALRAKLRQFNAQAELAGAARIPDITLSAMTGREAGDQLIKVGVTVPLPVLNSHRGAYEAALAQSERASTGLAWSEQQLRFAVDSAVQNHANAMQALANAQQSGMQKSAQETITLAQKAYDAGEIDLEELVVHIRQGLDARMTALEIIRQGWLTRIRLAEVLGHPEYILKGTHS